MNKRYKTHSNFFKTSNLVIFSAIAQLSIGIALGTLFSAINGVPANAQTNTVESNYLEDIEAGKDRTWGFSSASESISIEDNLSNLEGYSISEFDSSDVKLVEESRRFNSPRGIKDYSVEAEIYDY